MNEYQKHIMTMESIDTLLCPFCGQVATNKHHIVPRSQGGGKGPTVTVCGNGNTSGCHGDFHKHKLHLYVHEGRWVYYRSEEPVKFDKALADVTGWRYLND